MDDFSCEDLIDEPVADDDAKEFDESGYDMAYNNETGYLAIRHELGEDKTVAYYYSPKKVLESFVISTLNANREAYLKTKDKKYWKQLIQLLPTSYNQKRTIMLNYEVLANMYHSRKNHKLDEWHKLCDWIESLPYSEFITKYKPVYEEVNTDDATEL